MHYHLTLMSSIKDCMKHQNRGIDDLLLEAIKWPIKDRSGKTIDNTGFLESTLDIIEQSEYYRPTYKVWKAYIKSCSGFENRNKKRWQLVQRAFTGIFTNNRFFSPDRTFLLLGLDSAQAILDPNLATVLICNRLLQEQRENPTRVHGQYMDTDNFPKHSGGVPVQDIVRAIEICLVYNDIDGVKEILRTAVRATNVVSPRKMAVLYRAALKAFANAGYAAEVQAILSSMEEQGIPMDDELHSMAVHSFAVTEQLEKAQHYVEQLASNLTGKSKGPGLRTHEALVFASVKCKDWETAMSSYGTMKRLKLQPSPAVCHGLVMSSFQTGGRLGLLGFLNDMIESPGTLNFSGIGLAIKLLMPSIKGTDSIETTRKALRSMAEEKPEIHEAALDLSRSLRIAEVEESRMFSKALSLDEISERKRQAWKQTLRDLIKLVNLEAALLHHADP